MASPDDRFSGVVLTGGASRRMGRDKALLAVDGWPMATRVAATLAAAGAAEVFAVGGNIGALAEIGLDPRADRWPGAGPLGGLLTALTEARHPAAVVLACDLVAPAPAAVTRVLARLGDADVALPVADGRRQWLHAAWRVAAATPVLQGAFDAGERAIHRAVAGLTLVDVPDVDPGPLADADSPVDLPH